MLNLNTCFGCLSFVAVCLGFFGCTTKLANETEPPASDKMPYTDLASSGYDWPSLANLREGGSDAYHRKQDEARHLANIAFQNALNKPISIDFDNIPLDLAIAYLRDATGTNIAVNWPALAIVEINKESPVSLKLNNVSARKSLQLTLNQVSADAFDDDKAGFSVRENIVMVSTLMDLKSTTVVRQYSLDDFANTRPTANSRIYGQNNEARRMLGMTPLQNKAVDPNTIKVKVLNQGFCANCDKSHDHLDLALNVLTYYEKIEQIAELIQTTVGHPDEWLDEQSTLREINGILIVDTTEENHAQVRQLLDSMRLERARCFKRQALEMEVFLLLEVAETYRLRQEYRPALDKINQALRVDPTNPEAIALKEIVEATLSRS